MWIVDQDDPDVDHFPVVALCSSTHFDVLMCGQRSTYVLNISAFPRNPEDFCTYGKCFKTYASGPYYIISCYSHQIVSTIYISTVIQISSLFFVSSVIKFLPNFFLTQQFKV